MKLKIRYENNYQTIELSPEDTDQLWVSLSLEGEDIPQAEREKLIQDAWEKQYNRPDYNNWHKHTRHTGQSRAKANEDEELVNNPEPLMSEVADSRIFCSDMIRRDAKDTYDDLCEHIRAVLKPDYAEMIIAIHLDGMTSSEYALSIGEKPNTVNHRLQRAEKKFREHFSKTSL
ncbi:MAG: sigma factor-like helix-turn-helix DNA-binding protein [Christensenellales bacterium]|jgi:hypothetical protein